MASDYDTSVIMDMILNFMQDEDIAVTDDQLNRLTEAMLTTYENMREESSYSTPTFVDNTAELEHQISQLTYKVAQLEEQLASAIDNAENWRMACRDSDRQARSYMDR